VIGDVGRHHSHRRILAITGCAMLVMAGFLPVMPAAAGDAGFVIGSVRVFPLVIELSLGASSIGLGHTTRVEASVTNVGPATVQSIVVELRADPAGLAVRNDVVRIAQLKRGRSTTVSWSVCGAAIGTYVVLARVSAAGASIDSVAQLLSVTPGRRRCP